jgi:hypothetical protein
LNTPVPRKPSNPKGFFICPICSQVHNGEAKFCPTFGKPILTKDIAFFHQEPSAQSSKAAVRPRAGTSRRPLGWLIGGGVAVALLVAGLLFWFIKMVPAIQGTARYPTPTRRTAATQQPERKPTFQPTEVPEQALPPGAGVTPSGDPDILAGDTMIADLEDNQVDYLDSYAEEENGDAAYAPSRYIYTVTFYPDGQALFAFGWCTTTADILEQNFQEISMVFTLNGHNLHSKPTEYQWEESDRVCRIQGYELANWPYGEHHLEIAVTFETVINDGWSDYPQGTFYHDFTVYVGN